MFNAILGNTKIKLFVLKILRLKTSSIFPPASFLKGAYAKKGVWLENVFSKPSVT